jgi:hypothetical protein
LTLVILALAFPGIIRAEFYRLRPGASDRDACSWVVEPCPEGLRVRIQFPGIAVQSVAGPAGPFDRLAIHGCGRGGESGRPELPFKALLLEAPRDVEVRLHLDSFRSSVLPGRFRIYPKQPPRPDLTQAGDTQFLFDRSFYAMDRDLPERPVRIAGDGHLRERRVLYVEVFPVRYNPGRGQVSAISEMVFTLSFERRVSPDPDLRRYASAPFENLAARLLANYSPRQLGRPTGNRDGADYLIITHDDFVDALQPLVEWKQAKGWLVRVAPLSVVGSSAGEIQSYIRIAYHTWDPPPTYVLLVGDVDKLPSFVIGEYLTDLPYSLADDNDDWADMILGRISVRSVQGCETVIGKILSYDRPEQAQNWYRRALIAASFEDFEGPFCTADRYFFETATHVMEFLELQRDMEIFTAMVMVPEPTGTPVQTDYLAKGTPPPTPAPPTPCAEMHFRPKDYSHRFPYYDPIPDEWVDLFVEASKATQQIIDAFHAGIGLALHRDHGGPDGWGDPRFRKPEIGELGNCDMLPVVLSINCSTGMFDSSSDCFAEAIMEQVGGGAVGVIAASRTTYSGLNELLCHGIFTSFWPEYDPDYSPPPAPPPCSSYSFCVAQAMNFGKYYMVEWNQPDDKTTEQLRAYHWFGDPELLLRLDTPRTPDISLPPAIPIGADSAAWPISDDGALVAVSQDGVLLGRAFAADGSVHLELNPPVQAGPDVRVVVTGHDLLPLDAAIPPTSATATPTPEPSPTPLPDTCEIYLRMNSHFFRPGDACVLETLTLYTYAEDKDSEKYILLDVYGDYYYWPSWGTSQDNLLITLTYSPQFVVERIFDFTWPEGCGSADGLRFWTALLDPDTRDLISNIDSWEFGYEDFKAEFFVDGESGSDDGPGTYESPWKTIQKALDAVGPFADPCHPKVIHVAPLGAQVAYLVSGSTPLLIGQGITLRGAGAQKTALQDAGGGFVRLEAGSAIEGFSGDVPIRVEGGAKHRPARIEDMVLRGCPADTAAIQASGDAHLRVRNVLVVDNVGAVSADDQAMVQIEDATIASNDWGIRAAGQSEISVRNAIIADNIGNGVFVDPGAWVRLEYCNLHGNSYGGGGGDLELGPGIREDDPLFVPGPVFPDVAYLDYFLESQSAGGAQDSPCIDAGPLRRFPDLPYGTTRVDGIPDRCAADLGYRWRSIPEILVEIDDIGSDVRSDPVEQMLLGPIRDIVTYDPNHEIRTYLGEDDCTFIPHQQITGVGEVQQLDLEDMIGDAMRDLVVTTSGAGVRIYENDGTGWFIESGLLCGDRGRAAICFFDVDGDGSNEMAVGTGLGIDIYRKGADAPVLVQSLSSGPARVLAAGDVDGDRRPDLLVFDDRGRCLCHVNVHGRLDPAPQEQFVLFPIARALLIDVDRDGLADLLIRRDDDNYWILLNRRGRFQTPFGPLPPEGGIALQSGQPLVTAPPPGAHDPGRDPSCT